MLIIMLRAMCLSSVKDMHTCTFVVIGPQRVFQGVFLAICQACPKDALLGLGYDCFL